MTFGQALEALKSGKRVRRAGWNGKNMWIALTPGLELPTGAVLRGAAEKLGEEIASQPEGDRRALRICDHIDMRAADGTLVIGWLASQTDMLAEDWELVE